MTRCPTWKGDGTPQEMWLLQLDLGEHSSWTIELSSNADAFRFRKEFARRITEEVSIFGFDRLSWAGDGGVYVTAGAHNVIHTINAAHQVHKVFEEWRDEVRHGNILKLFVSIHRTRVTTADDPSLCYGPELNDFMKYEQQLRDLNTQRSIVVTGRIYEDLTFEQQQPWGKFPQTVACLGPVFSYRPGDTTPPAQTANLNWLSGAWHNIESGSWGYSRTDHAGRTKFVYCYAGDLEHTGNYENFQYVGDDIVGTFAWIKSPISGRFRLTPNATRSQMTGGWWYAEDLDNSNPPSFETPKIHRSQWTKVHDKKFPDWAEEALIK